MDSLGWMNLAGGFINMWGKFEQGRAARIAGERQKMAAEFQAWQAERQAGIEVAISQRKAHEETRGGRYAVSRTLAVAAASGAGVSDPTIVNLIANTEGEANYRAQVALYEGQSARRQLRLAAASARVGGSQAVVEGRRQEFGLQLSGIGSLARTGASLYSKYGVKSAGAITGGGAGAHGYQDGGIEFAEEQT